MIAWLTQVALRFKQRLELQTRPISCHGLIAILELRTQLELKLRMRAPTLTIQEACQC